MLDSRGHLFAEVVLQCFVEQVALALGEAVPFLSGDMTAREEAGCVESSPFM
jgi:hypothetical protein